MTAVGLCAILALIGLACCAAVYCAERDVERQDRERVDDVTKPRPNIIPDRGWHATNYEGGHHPEARETQSRTGWRPGCTCPFDCLSRDPGSDIVWPTAGEAKAEADRLLRERGAR